MQAVNETSSPHALITQTTNTPLETKLLESTKPYNGYIDGNITEGRRILYINGILNNEEDCRASAKAISQLFNNEKVYYTFVPTQGVYRDIAHTLSTLTLGYTHRAVSELIDNIRERIYDLEQECTKPEELLQAKILADANNELSPDQLAEIPLTRRKVIIFSHSAGGIPLDQAAKKLKPEEKADLFIYTFGSAVVFGKEGFRKVKNYVNIHDPIPRICSYFGGWMSSWRGGIKKLTHTGKQDFMEAHYFLGEAYKKALLNVSESIQSIGVDAIVKKNSQKLLPEN